MAYCIMQKCLNVMCGQRMPRSDCAYAQSDQGICCPLTESMATVEYIYTDKPWALVMRMLIRASLFIYDMRIIFLRRAANGTKTDILTRKSFF